MAFNHVGHEHNFIDDTNTNTNTNFNEYPYPPPSTATTTPTYLNPFPYYYPYPQSSSSSNATLTPGTGPKPDGSERTRTRTPSPTPSEARELKTGVLDWKTVGKWRFWIRKKWIWYYIALVVILVITALVTLYHKQIVEWLTPVTRWLHDLRFGWLVPIGVLFVISFPPLFGHEIVAVLCGLVWGLWIGFGIVSAGTFLGEVGNFYAFKYCCRARGEKLERTKITYACLAKVVRDGGFKIALIARLSAIPGHFTTAVFSTCGMGIFMFSIAAILSLPKQFITVYLGVILEQSSTGVKDPKSRIISDVVLAVTFIITIIAMWYIFRQMNKVKPEVIYARRKARQAKLPRIDLSPYSTSTFSASSQSTVAFDPYPTDSDSIPLKLHTNLHPHPYHIHVPQPQATSAYSHDVDASAAYTGISCHRRASMDDVGWDMGGVGGGVEVRHARTEDMYGYMGASADSVETVRVRGERRYGESERRYGGERGQGSEDIGDGGRGEMVTPAQVWSGEEDVQTLMYRAPGRVEEVDVDGVGRGRGHMQETADTTYRSVKDSLRSSDDDIDHDSAANRGHAQGAHIPIPIPLRPPPGRVLSPPPPSYRTNVG